MRRLILTAFCLILSLILGKSQSNLVPIHHDSGTIAGMVFSADSQRILSWSGDSVRVWNVSTGEMLLELRPQIPTYVGGLITSAAWLENETQIRITYQEASHSAISMIWDATTGELLSSENYCTGNCAAPDNDVDWSSQSSDSTGQRLAQWESIHCRENCSNDLILSEADASQITLAHSQRIKHAYWSSSGNYLITSSVPTCMNEVNCTAPLSIWAVAPDSETYGVATVDAPCLVWGVQWTRDESRFFIRSDGWWRRAFDGASENCHAIWQSFTIEGDLLWTYENVDWNSSYQLQLSPDESRLLLHGQGDMNWSQVPNYEIVALNATTGAILETVMMDGFVSESSPFYTTPYTRYAYQAEENEIIIWDAWSLEEIQRFRLASPLANFTDAYGRTFPMIYWFPEASLGYALTLENQLYFWDSRTWEQIAYLESDLRFQTYYLDLQMPDLLEMNYLGIIAVDETNSAAYASSAWLLDIAARRVVFSINMPDEYIFDIQGINENRLFFSTDCIDCNGKIYVYDTDKSELILADESAARHRIEIINHYLIWRDLPEYSEEELPAMPIRIWDLETGELHLNLNAYAYAISPQGGKILIYGEEATAIYELATGEELTRFPFPAGNRWHWAWSPDERFIVFKVNGDSVADIYSAETGEWLFPNRRG